MGGHGARSLKPIVIIAEPGREQEAAIRLGRIGFDHVKGFLKDGMEALKDREDLLWPTERVTAPMLAEELAGKEPPMLLDVRNTREYAGRADSSKWRLSAAP